MLPDINDITFTGFPVVHITLEPMQTFTVENVVEPTEKQWQELANWINETL
jgi:hypothetical protein